jgi:hypothetical protein
MSERSVINATWLFVGIQIFDTGVRGFEDTKTHYTAEFPEFK